MGVALVLDQGELAHPRIGLAQSHAVRFASRTSFSRARLRSFASVGNVTFLGCTVVSTITRDSSDGLIASVLVATDRLSCSKRLQPLLAHAVAPARQRRAIEHQPVLEELLAAEELVIGVLDPALAQHLVGEVIGVLEDGQPRHQSRRQRRAAGIIRVDLAERPSRNPQSTVRASATSGCFRSMI